MKITCSSNNDNDEYFLILNKQTRNAIDYRNKSQWITFVSIVTEMINTDQTSSIILIWSLYLIELDRSFVVEEDFLPAVATCVSLTQYKSVIDKKTMSDV